MLIFDLFLAFAKIGLFTFGGGYAMIALIEDYCVNQRKWITNDDMMNLTIIAESTPGPIAINCATFVGYKQAGLPGAISATLGMTLPSFVVIYLISMFLDNFLEITIVAKAFAGIRIAVGILILNAAINMMRKMKKKTFSVIILVSAFVSMMVIQFFSLKISVIILMIIAGMLGAAVNIAEILVQKKHDNLAESQPDGKRGVNK